MSHTDPEPTGDKPLSKRLEWLEPRAIDLVFRSAPPEKLFANVVRARRSHRFIATASLEEVARVVRETLKADFVGHGEKQGRKLKAVLSAGALHPVKAVILRRNQAPIVYDDSVDQFLSVHVRDAVAFEAFLRTCETVLPDANGHWVALIADSRNVRRLYSNHESLVWRDAGAVIQLMALSAEAQEMAFCPLGVLGGEIVAALLPGTPEIIPVGVVALGRKAGD
ncbi:nitroreductase family protein [Ensifer sp. 22521]|uniref:nitroreductase family protein n=1 Tax=Ensifer sp. 22521 TaxID=3453935 RepID=UPI003F838081